MICTAALTFLIGWGLGPWRPPFIDSHGNFNLHKANIDSVDTIKANVYTWDDPEYILFLSDSMEFQADDYWHVQANQMIEGDAASHSVRPSASHVRVWGHYNDSIIGNFTTVWGGDNDFTSGSYATTWGLLNDFTGGQAATVWGEENDSTTGMWATVHGYSNDHVSGSNASVWGRDNDNISGHYTTVWGKDNNDVSGNYATVWGGDNPYTTGNFATVWGENHDSTLGSHATVWGDNNDYTSGSHATVWGLQNQYTSGIYATVWGTSNDSIRGEGATVWGKDNWVDNCIYSTAFGIGAEIWGSPNDSCCFITGTGVIDSASYATIINGDGDDTLSTAHHTLIGTDCTIDGDITADNFIGNSDSFDLFLRHNGIVPLSANWPAGDFDITGLEKVEADTIMATVQLNVATSFHVTSDGIVRWGSATEYGELTWNTGRAIIQGKTGQHLVFGANSAEKARILTTGEFGINTTGPDYKLEVLNASGPQACFTHTDNTIRTTVQTTSTGKFIIDASGDSVELNCHVKATSFEGDGSLLTGTSGGFNSYMTVTFTEAAVESLAQGAWAKIEFDTVLFDGGSEWNAASHMWGAASTGYYAVEAHIAMTVANGEGITVSLVAISGSDSTQIAYGKSFLQSAGFCPNPKCFVLINLSAGDSLFVRAYNHGAAKYKYCNELFHTGLSVYRVH